MHAYCNTTTDFFGLIQEGVRRMEWAQPAAFNQSGNSVERGVPEIDATFI